MKHLISTPHSRGVEIGLGCKIAKQIANQNCYWPVTQVMADKLLIASKRLIHYIALYSMAGVAMDNRLFRIHPNAREHAIYGGLRGLPNTKNEPEPGYAQWMPSSTGRTTPRQICSQ